MDFSTYLPQKYKDLDELGHLHGYSELISFTLTHIESQIDDIEKLPELQREWFARAWCDLLGFPELPEIFVWEDLRHILPGFLRLVKMKGRREPIAVLTERLFSDIQPLMYTLPNGNVFPNNEYIVTISVPSDYPSKIAGVSTASYLSTKIVSLNRLLLRFVPVFLDPVVSISLAPFVDNFGDAFSDDGFGFVIELDDAFSNAMRDNLLLIDGLEPAYPPLRFVEPFIPFVELPVWNDHQLQEDEINSVLNASFVGHFDDTELDISEV